MFIIPTGLLREKSIATMIYTVSTEIIEKILSREMKVTDLDYMIFTWQDAFILELLKWFDKKINEIPERKIDKRDPDNFYHWKTYYEQYIRIFYYFVIYRGIQDPKELRKIFKFLFTVNKKDNPYRNDYDMISAEKLMKVYKYITHHISNELYNDYEDCENRKSINNLVGLWNTENMKDKLECIVIETYKGSEIIKRTVNIYDIFKVSDSYSETNRNKIILDTIKNFFNDFLNIIQDKKDKLD